MNENIKVIVYDNSLELRKKLKKIGSKWVTEKLKRIFLKKDFTWVVIDGPETFRKAIVETIVKRNERKGRKVVRINKLEDLENFENCIAIVPESEFEKLEVNNLIEICRKKKIKIYFVGDMEKLPLQVFYLLDFMFVPIEHKIQVINADTLDPFAELEYE